MSDDPPVVPIKPELAVKGDASQMLLEKLNRRFAEFSAEHGPPQAFALVLIDAKGTTRPYYQTLGAEPRRGGWRGFLALAGARLTAIALED